MFKLSAQNYLLIEEMMNVSEKKKKCATANNGSNISSIEQKMKIITFGSEKWIYLVKTAVYGI